MANTFETQGVQIPLDDPADGYPYPEYINEHRTPDIEIVESDTEISHPSSNKSVSRSRAKRDRKIATSTRPINSKPKLRPASDILSRIRHDPSLNIDDYVIGYHDRHLPEIQEIEVSLWKGGGDVTDEEFIPGHRIAWFRLKGEDGRKVWDRSERLDRIFGSGVQSIEDEDQTGGASDVDSSDDGGEVTQVQDEVAGGEACTKG